MARAATNADPPRLETPEVIKWSVATVLAMCRPFAMPLTTLWWTFPIPISLPASAIPIVEIFPDFFAKREE